MVHLDRDLCLQLSYTVYVGGSKQIVKNSTVPRSAYFGRFRRSDGVRIMGHVNMERSPVLYLSLRRKVEPRFARNYDARYFVSNSKKKGGRFRGTYPKPILRPPIDIQQSTYDFQIPVNAHKLSAVTNIHTSDR